MNCVACPIAMVNWRAYAFGMAEQGWLYQLAGLPAKLAVGNYRLVSDWGPEQRLQASLGWGLACYQFDLYRESSREMPSLVLDDDIVVDAERLLSAQSLVRDLVNTPTEDLGPGTACGCHATGGRSV